MRGSARAVLIVFATLAVVCPFPAAAEWARPAVTRATQPLLILDRRVLARAAPTPQAPVVGAVAARTPLTGAQTVLPVVAKATGSAGGSWLRVRLPMRPNGATGWVPAYTGASDATSWRIVIHRGWRRAFVFDDGRPRARFAVVVGKSTTPTPLGTFFVVEKLHLGARAPGAPWALATSAYSNVLQEFAGGPGQVALHGTSGLAGALGTFASHGCIRFAPSAITWIADHVDAGTPIVVSR
jgi:lipoprotein-anchoring transpeptidase ErfK/SrfK